MHIHIVEYSPAKKKKRKKKNNIYNKWMNLRIVMMCKRRKKYILYDSCTKNTKKYKLIYRDRKQVGGFREEQREEEQEEGLQRGARNILE